ncbi:MAG: hypothetical protein GWN73_10550, partial [Actinobacteria bacterium]|nr:hypothetical protein [Actinomycetota bacterium]
MFFYGPGIVELQVPAGEVTVTAARGLATPTATETAAVGAGRVTEVEVDLAPVW